jgi:uncharacterized protein YycO
MYNAYYFPTSPKVDIQPILKNSILSPTNYSLLYSQTGLARQAIDDLLIEKEGVSKILSFQNNYFTKNKLYFEKLNPFTSQEFMTVNGKLNNESFEIAPIKNGDILLTKSTYTLYWRHGHCGIVIDAKNGTTLESLEPGTISMQQNISKWQSYPTFKLMRLKDVDQKKLDEIAWYAAKNLVGVKYNIFASKKDDKELKYENCSQLIYQAFNHFGYDIDNNKGIFVTPKDIAKSKLLEIVQIHGFNPKRDW